MSVTHVIFGARTAGRRVQPEAILELSRRQPVDWPAPRVTSRRARRVGLPTPRRRPALEALDPLVLEAAVTGLESVGALERQSAEVARDFRWHRIAAGRAGLMQLVEGLQTVVQLAVSAANAAGREPEGIPASGGRSASETTRRAVHALVTDQASGDWHGLAGTIDRLLVPALDAWRGVFESIAGGRDDFDPDVDPSGHAA
jgi:hypothetical protein